LEENRVWVLEIGIFPTLVLPIYGCIPNRREFSRVLFFELFFGQVSRLLRPLCPIHIGTWCFFREVAISVLSQAETGTFLVLPQTLLLRGFDHVHEYQIIRENKIGWYLKVRLSCIKSFSFFKDYLRREFLITCLPKSHPVWGKKYLINSN